MKTENQYILISSIIIWLVMVSITLLGFEYFSINPELKLVMLLIFIEVIMSIYISAKLINR